MLELLWDWSSRIPLCKEGFILGNGLAPTHMRWFVFFSLFLLCAVNYMDRTVIFICMPLIEEELQFSPAVVGFILSSFFWEACACPAAPIAVSGMVC
jgi:hypothetical protein